MHLLDNPIWSALTTDHAPLALGAGRARRYPAEIGPLAGMRDASQASYAELAQLAMDSPVVLFDVNTIEPPDGWKVIRRGPIVQMCRTSRLPFSHTDSQPAFRQLTLEDAPAMVALAELTEPGPFRVRTIELGNFYGVFHAEQLMAMAGKRMHLPAYLEVSGVCTHPDARGRGYAQQLMSVVIEEIEREGRTAFLHALADNPAIRLYERLGFTLRQNFEFAVLLHQP